MDNHHPRNYRTSRPNCQQQLQQNTNKDDEKKNRSRNKRYNKNHNQNHNQNQNDLSDASVGTNSSGEGSTNSWNTLRSQQFQNRNRFTASTTSVNKSNAPNNNGNIYGKSKSRKEMKNNNGVKNHQRNSQENSVALNSYLRQRGWSLSDDLYANLKHNIHGSNNNNSHSHNVASATTVSSTTITNTSGTSTATALLESEMVRKRALKLLETTLCRWAASIEKNPIAWQRVRGTYWRTLCIHFYIRRNSFRFDSIPFSSNALVLLRQFIQNRSAQ